MRKKETTFSSKDATNIMNVYHQGGNNLGEKDPKPKQTNVHFEKDAENKQIISWR